MGSSMMDCIHCTGEVLLCAMEWPCWNCDMTGIHDRGDWGIPLECRAVQFIVFNQLCCSHLYQPGRILDLWCDRNPWWPLRIAGIPSITMHAIIVRLLCLTSYATAICFKRDESWDLDLSRRARTWIISLIRLHLMTMVSWARRFYSVLRFRDWLITKDFVSTNELS